MSNGAQSAAGVATYRTVRELGSRSPRSHAAIREPNELVVTYRFARAVDAKVTTNVASLVGDDGAIALGSDAMDNLVRDARCLEKNWHPNIARVRHVDAGPDELVIATELVDGATLEDLFAFAAAKRPAGAPAEPFLPLPVVVRVLVDVLAGLHGLHGLRDATSGTLGVIHGALCPANIVVGKDGVARIINPLRARPVQVGAASEAVGYGAPEALDVGGTSDPRADVHGVGIILWESLTGRRLYDERDPVRVLARQREEEIEPPTFSPGSPFAAIAEVVLHALAFDPSLRFKTASEMGSALRTIAGSQIATGSVVAAQVAELAGERIRARRIELDPSMSGTRRRTSSAQVPAAQPATVSSPQMPVAKPATASSPKMPLAKPATASSDAPSLGASMPTTPFAPVDAPSPPSRRATVPPAALAELDSLDVRAGNTSREAEGEMPPPPSLREELSLRDLMAAAPPVHESAMVAQTSTPSVPEAAPPRAFGAPPAPRVSPAVPPRAAPLPRPVATAARSATVPPAATTPLQRGSTPMAPKESPAAFAPTPIATPAPAPDTTFAPATDAAPASDTETERSDEMLSAPPPPPLRKASPMVLAGATVIALIGAGLALRAIFSDPTPRPTTTAATVRPAAELPSSAVSAPTATTTTDPASADAKAKAEAEAKARDEAEAKGKAEAEAKARDEAAAKPAEPTPLAEPQGAATLLAPRPASPRPTAVPRPKKPYEPSGI